MNIDTMRFLDRYVGIPLCWLMGLLCRFINVQNARRNRLSVKNILVIKFFGMGSILLATPALRLIKNEFPNARITFLSFRQNCDLLDRIQSVDEVLAIDRSTFLTFVKDTLSAIRTLLHLRADITFDMEFFSKFSTLLSGISHAPVRVGFELPTHWRSAVVTHQVPLVRNSHVLRAFCSLLFPVAGTADVIPPIEPPRISDTDHCSLLQKVSIEGRRVVAININAGDTFLERRWPAERYAELVTTMARDDDATFCFLGDVNERNYVQRTIDKTDCAERCLNTSGMLTIPELGALLQRSVLLISNDSGPLHLAAALGVPTLGLYGPESPDFYGVRHHGAQTIFHGIPCSPCMNVYAAKQFRCPYDAQCMREISVAAVLHTIRSMLYVSV